MERVGCKKKKLFSAWSWPEGRHHHGLHLKVYPQSRRSRPIRRPAIREGQSPTPRDPYPPTDQLQLAHPPTTKRARTSSPHSPSPRSQTHLLLFYFPLLLFFSNFIVTTAAVLRNPFPSAISHIRHFQLELPRDSSSRRPTLARSATPPSVATLLRTRHLVAPPLLSRGGVSSGTGSIASAGKESLEQAQTKLLKVQWTDTSGKETLSDRDKVDIQLYVQSLLVGSPVYYQLQLQRLLWPWFCCKCWRGVSLKEVQPWKLINKSVNRNDWKGFL